MSDQMNAWRERIPEFSGPLTLEVAGFEVAVELTPKQVGEVFLPLLKILREAAETQRVLAGVCGIPAGGKTTFAAALRHISDRLLGPGVLQIVAMDAWHFPNTLLEARSTRDASGRMIPLRERKGGPESYDVEAMAAALDRLRDPSISVQLPVYDRRLHEPRPDGVCIAPETRIVVVEGNYVLGGVRDVPAWDRVAAFLSPKLFIQCDPGTARERMIARHVRGGATHDAAVAKYASNDQLNTQLILHASSYADYHVFAFLDTRPGLSVWPPFAPIDA